MSNATLKPIIVWGHEIGPNPLKVRMILEELDLPYEYKIVAFEDMKKEPFISINPNGRVPAIEDPNTGLVLCESGPIVEYLVEQYDKEYKISYEGFEERYLIRQWIGFQISGELDAHLSPAFYLVLPCLLRLRCPLAVYPRTYHTQTT